MNNYPLAVVLHDRDHGDVGNLPRIIGMEAPYGIVSLTDTHPDINLFNLKLDNKIFHYADALLVQDELALTGSYTVEYAVGKSALSGVRTQLFVFDDDFNVTKVNMRYFYGGIAPRVLK